MSRLLRNAEAASRLGSFVLRHRDAGFRPIVEGTPFDVHDDFEPFGMGDENKPAPEADAYARGHDDGRRAAEVEFAEAREAVTRLAQSLDVLRPEPTNALALLLAEAVDRLVREIIGSVDVDATLLLSRARAAAAMIGENVEPSKLRVHPEDVELLRGAELGLDVEGDPSLERGAIRLETGHGWIEDGPLVRLERLRAELDKMAGRS
jgi:flagellar assembly protein FliH